VIQWLEKSVQSKREIASELLCCAYNPNLVLAVLVGCIVLCK